MMNISKSERTTSTLYLPLIFTSEFPKHLKMNTKSNCLLAVCELPPKFLSYLASQCYITAG